MQVEELGREIDLSMEVDRIDLVLSLVRAYFLMVVMAASVPRLSRRPMLYGRIPRGPVGNTLRQDSTRLLADRRVSSSFHVPWCCSGTCCSELEDR